jgi:hypothetical protein
MDRRVALEPCVFLLPFQPCLRPIPNFQTCITSVPIHLSASGTAGTALPLHVAMARPWRGAMLSRCFLAATLLTHGSWGCKGMCCCGNRGACCTMSTCSNVCDQFNNVQPREKSLLHSCSPAPTICVHTVRSCKERRGWQAPSCLFFEAKLWCWERRGPFHTGKQGGKASGPLMRLFSPVGDVLECRRGHAGLWRVGRGDAYRLRSHTRLPSLGPLQTPSHATLRL